LLLLDVKPGMRVVDTCAVLAEKHTHCCFNGNKGQLIAMDLYESKLKQLKIRAKEMVLLILNIALLTLQSD
jgi:16S rRNA (cytosine967-C5)-methyltransferase